ncbi:MAG: hypothetical protein IPM39_15115 [Chloroflexi bacterium]|nr:hypothetical protein [Chloroflexota bacterium]
MVDLDAAAVALALGNAVLATAVSNRIYGGDAPPAGYDPANGAVCIKSRGGQTRYDPLIDSSFQVKCYGATPPAAWQVYQLTYDALHEAHNGRVAFSQSEVTGQQLTEPGTGRVFILAYFRMVIRP